jgi:uncharacterized protein (DUF4415 family)
MVNGFEITVIYVDLDADERRIISAWRSEPHERREYWKNIKRLSTDQDEDEEEQWIQGKARNRESQPQDRLVWPATPCAGSDPEGIAADPDAHATDAAFWKSAQVVLPTPKEAVTMRLDADLLRWFRRERGYQTRINAMRAYMQAHES